MLFAGKPRSTWEKRLLYDRRSSGTDCSLDETEERHLLYSELEYPSLDEIYDSRGLEIDSELEQNLPHPSYHTQLLHSSAPFMLPRRRNAHKLTPEKKLVISTRIIFLSLLVTAAKRQ